MRDIILLLVVFLLLARAIKKPYIALFLWLWSSMLPLQNWSYGVADGIRFNLIFSSVCILGFLIKKPLPPQKLPAIQILLFIFLLHALCSVIFSPLSNNYQWSELGLFAKSILFSSVIFYAVREKWHFDGIALFITLSLPYFGFVEGLKYIASAGGHKISGVEGAFGDNNKFAFGLIITLPFIIYLVQHYITKSYAKVAGVAFIIICIATVLGSNSRGALIALLVMGGYYWLYSHKKAASLIAILTLASIFLLFLPESWFDRMDTINTANTDSSFIERVTFWKINTLSAFDNPIFGVGFDGTSAKTIWQIHTENLYLLDFLIETPIPHTGFVAHNIFFQVLGNQGFVGLAIFITIIALTLSSTNKTINNLTAEGWQKDFAKSLRISTLSFCTGGLALNGAYLEFFYLIVALSYCLTASIISNPMKTVDTKCTETNFEL